MRRVDPGGHRVDARGIEPVVAHELFAQGFAGGDGSRGRPAVEPSCRGVVRHRHRNVPRSHEYRSARTDQPAGERAEPAVGRAVRVHDVGRIRTQCACHRQQCRAGVCDRSAAQSPARRSAVPRPRCARLAPRAAIRRVRDAGIRPLRSGCGSPGRPSPSTIRCGRSSAGRPARSSLGFYAAATLALLNWMR